MVYGIDGNQNIQHLGKLRWNIARPLTIYLTGRQGEKAYQSALNDNRSYTVTQQSAEPSLTYLYKSTFRVTALYKYEERKNAAALGGEQAAIHQLNLDLRFSRPATGVIQIRGGYSEIFFKGLATAPVAFIMLDALQPGSNFLWYLNWERRIGKGIEVSLEYEGRQPGTGNVIHTGRMSVRAIL